MTPTSSRRLRLLAAVTLLAAFIAANLSPAARGWLAYDRAAILHGQVWRLVTGHLVHLGPMHLLLDGTGLVLIVLIYREVFTPARLLGVGTLTALGISAGLLALNPTLQWYMGLSGVLHGLLVVGAVWEIRQGRHANWLVLGVVGAKLGWEHLYGASTLTTHLIGGTVVTAAHLYGAAAGLVVALIWPPPRRHPGNTPP